MIPGEKVLDPNDTRNVTSQVVKSNKKPSLPKHCYARGNKIWVRYKDENGKWRNIPCGRPAYNLNQTELARRFVDALLRGVERKVERGTSDPDTIAAYARKWCDERDARGVESSKQDRQRLEDYILPEVGQHALEHLRPRHVADLVYKLRARTGPDALAPRTIHHIFNTLHTLYESAILDELVWGANPVKVKPGVLPKKTDADLEWRAEATFYTREVIMLITGRDKQGTAIIPIERRVQYALKALAGLRHGEVAALCWRHIDEMAEPLWKINVAQAWSTPKKKIKRTKTEESRAVPVHPVLRAILTAWRDSHWKRIYGRAPGKDDFVVPARTGRPIDGGDAVEAFERDLRALDLRVEAGSRRKRNGHDLRAWYETQSVEDGADSTLIWRTTHAPPKDVKSGYQRFSWAAYCRAVSCLKVEFEGDPLQLVTTSLQSESKAQNRWRKVVTPKGLEADRGLRTEKVGCGHSETCPSHPMNSSERLVTRPVTPLVTAAGMIERAVLVGDLPKILEIVRQLREQPR